MDEKQVLEMVEETPEADMEIIAEDLLPVPETIEPSEAEQEAETEEAEASAEDSEETTEESEASTKESEETTEESEASAEDTEENTEDSEATAEEPEEVASESEGTAEEPEAPTEESEGGESEGGGSEGGGSVPPGPGPAGSRPVADRKSANGPKAWKVPKRESKPYLQYGEEETPKGLDLIGTRSFLQDVLHYDGGELRQARFGKDGDRLVDTTGEADACCSYCGLPISGVDYFRLRDGRLRCSICSQTQIRSLVELNKLFTDVLLNMEQFFNVRLTVPVHVELLEERRLMRKLNKGLMPLPKGAVILGVAVDKKEDYTIYLENGAPRASVIATMAHELTHIWQYTHWQKKQVMVKYPTHSLEIYEGMAKWTELQYLYLIGERTMADREVRKTLLREDEYGRGFQLYISRYPFVKEPMSFFDSPFKNGRLPFDE